MQSQDKHDGIASVWQDKQRNYKIDYIKGILITLVVFGHSIQYGSGLTFFSEECYFDDTLFKIIYSFHMPCFGIISGFLYYNHVRVRTFGEKMHKVGKLLLPMLCFAIVNTSVSLFNGSITASISSVIQKYIWVVLYNWWFIWSIIICYIFWAVLELLKLGRLVKLILAFSTQILFVILPNRANSPLYGFIFFYFLIGYSLTGLLPLYKKWGGHYIKNTVVALWIICIFFYQRENYIYTSQLSVNNIYNSPLKQLEVNVFRWVTGIVGSFSFMKICNRYIKKFSPGILALFSYMGKNTIYIYILQSFFCVGLLQIIKVELVQIHYFANVMQTFFILILCCILIYGFQKTKQDLQKKERV